MRRNSEEIFAGVIKLVPKRLMRQNKYFDSRSLSLNNYWPDICPPLLAALQSVQWVIASNLIAWYQLRIGKLGKGFGCSVPLTLITTPTLTPLHISKLNTKRVIVARIDARIMPDWKLVIVIRMEDNMFKTSWHRIRIGYQRLWFRGNFLSRLLPEEPYISYVWPYVWRTETVIYVSRRLSQCYDNSSGHWEKKFLMISLGYKIQAKSVAKSLSANRI